MLTLLINFLAYIQVYNLTYKVYYIIPPFINIALIFRINPSVIAEIHLKIYYMAVQRYESYLTIEKATFASARNE